MPLLSRIRNRLFHSYFVIRRPMTLGVRAIVHDEGTGSVMLVRHTYVAGWQLPGGGVETGETAVEALARELAEECNVELAGPPELRSFHFNRGASQRDHVALYLVRSFHHRGAKRPDREIAEAGFFQLDGLPEDTTPATRTRLAEVFEAQPASGFW